MRNVSAFQPRPPAYLRGSTHSLDLELSSSQYASIADASQTGLDLNSDFTIECWVKFETTATDMLIVAKRTSTGNQRSYGFGYGSAGVMLLDVFSDGSTGAQKTVTFTPTAGTWYHIAVAYNKTAGECMFYLDGNQTGATQTGMQTTIYNSTSPFSIGCLFAPAQDFFDGLISDVRVWSDIRTAQEIRDNRFTQLVGNESNLVGYWKLNNDYTDSTANGNTLTASGSPVFSTTIPVSFASNTTKAYYPLNGNSNDYSGNTNTGTDTSITYPQGRFGQGAKFNGSTSVITATDASSLDISGDFTIASWVKPSLLGVNQAIVAKFSAASGNYSYRFMIDDTNKIAVYISADGTTSNRNTYTSTSAAITNTSKWVSVIVTYSVSGNSVTAYINGDRIAGTTSVTGTVTSIKNGTAPLTIGASGAGTEFFFNGLIDEVALESRAWTAKEVEAYYKKSTLNYSSKSLAQVIFTYTSELLKGTYTLTGKNLSTFRNYISSLLKGAYTLTGRQLTTTRGYIATLLKGAYTLVGKALRVPIAWTNPTKNTANYTNPTKSTEDWTNTDKS